MRGNDGVEERTPPREDATDQARLTPEDPAVDDDTGANDDVSDEPAAEVLADEPEAEDQLLPGPFESLEDPTPHG